jgi:hypothetical protein
MPKSTFVSNVRETLLQVIDDHVTRKHEFVKDPKRDFTRNRKLNLQNVLKGTLLLGSGSIEKELLEYFDYTTDTATGSAFTQQRDKLSSSIFKSLFKQFTHHFDHYKTFMGYRVLAVDGSDLHTPHNPNDLQTYFQSTPESKGFNLVHVNALYDLVNRIYLDGRIQSGRELHERKALIEMIQASELGEKVLVIGDRGYESYNVFAHMMVKGLKFLIRVKDKSKSSMLGSFDLPKTDVYDQLVYRKLTRKQTKDIKSQPNLYKFLPMNVQFDFLNEHVQFYPITLRVVRVQLDDGSFQCFITNLEENLFSAETIKTLYHMRWGIETSFRELKHTLALTHLHSKKKESIAQEIFAKMTMYNFCSIITSHVVIKKKDRKYDYQVNFSKAISICKRFLKESNTFLDVEKLLQKYILPIRNGRTCPRRVKFRTFVSFNYRVA